MAERALMCRMPSTTRVSKPSPPSLTQREFELFDFELPRSRLLSTVVLVTGMYSLRREPWMFRLGFGLAILAFLASWLTQRFDAPALILADYLLTGAFFALLTALILSAILAEQVVTFDTVMGGLCIYLLLGVMWVSLTKLSKSSMVPYRRPRLMSVTNGGP